MEAPPGRQEDRESAHSGGQGAAPSPAGVSTKELMHRLGQSTANAAMVYQHATRKRDQEIAAGIDARLKALDETDPEDEEDDGGVLAMARKIGNKEAQVRRNVLDLGFDIGACDENRTRTVSLGISDHLEHMSVLDTVTRGRADRSCPFMTTSGRGYWPTTGPFDLGFR